MFLKNVELWVGKEEKLLSAASYEHPHFIAQRMSYTMSAEYQETVRCGPSVDVTE